MAEHCVLAHEQKLQDHHELQHLLYDISVDE